MLAAMDIGLLDVDLDPAFHPRTLLVALVGLDDAGGAVDMQADPFLVEVEKDHADVGVLGDVAERGHDPVAAILRIAQRPGVRYLDEADGAGPERTVAFAVAVGGGDPDHLLTADEGDHLLVQPVEHLLTIEAAGPVLGPVAALQRVLAPRAGRDGVAGWRWRGRTVAAVPGEPGRRGDG
jgi:hypothetical protein